MSTLKDPRPLLRYDGTRRRERVSGTVLYPILLLWTLAIFTIGIQIGKYQPALPNTPVAQHTQHAQRLQ